MGRSYAGSGRVADDDLRVRQTPISGRYREQCATTGVGREPRFPMLDQSAFGNARRLTRTTAYGLRCERTLSAMNSRSSPPSNLRQSGHSNATKRITSKGDAPPTETIRCNRQCSISTSIAELGRHRATAWMSCAPYTRRWKSTLGRSPASKSAERDPAAVARQTPVETRGGCRRSVAHLSRASKRRRIPPASGGAGMLPMKTD